MTIGRTIALTSIAHSSQKINQYKNSRYNLFSAESTCILGQHCLYALLIMQCIFIVSSVHCMAKDLWERSTRLVKELDFH